MKSGVKIHQAHYAILLTGKKKEALECQQHQMKIELCNILRENKDPYTRDEVRAQVQVRNPIRRGVEV